VTTAEALPQALALITSYTQDGRESCERFLRSTTADAETLIVMLAAMGSMLVRRTAEADYKTPDEVLASIGESLMRMELGDLE
jgi:hypothetical protein